MNNLIEVWTDGGSRGNPGPASWGVVIKHNDLLVELSDFIPHATNNTAEYVAMIKALKFLNEYQEPGDVVIRADSQLIVRQVIGVYECHSGELEPLYIEAISLYEALREKRDVHVMHIPREQNKHADMLCNKAMDAVGAKFLKHPKKVVPIQ